MLVTNVSVWVCESTNSESFRNSILDKHENNHVRTLHITTCNLQVSTSLFKKAIINDSKSAEN